MSLPISVLDNAVKSKCFDMFSCFYEFNGASDGSERKHCHLILLVLDGLLEQRVRTRNPLLLTARALAVAGAHASAELVKPSITYLN